MRFHKVRIIKKRYLNHNVISVTIERPVDYLFTAGQAIEVAIEEPKFKHDAAPFTLSGLSNSPTLEIIFKVYLSHSGMTLALSKLKKGNILLITDAWDSFSYNTPGVFIAGGTGITPFLAILRNLNLSQQLVGNSLIIANQSAQDIFLQDELDELLGDKVTYILSKQPAGSFHVGKINKHFLDQNISTFNQSFYLCGPGSFSKDIAYALQHFGAKKELIHSEY